MLTDLDELMLSVRDPESRAYLREALISYRGGAYRAAIVSVWIAVVYDIISKVRILASQGDKAAEAVIKPFDTAITNNDLKALLKIEDGMLDEARDTFQLINRLEHDDLLRIKQDRHRCAHPAFASDTLLFNPSPEIVRAHIVHAVNHLLGHPPVQGKAAIETVVRDIASLSFPRKQDDVDKLLNLRCLDHARESLVGSLVVVLAKALLRKDNPILLGHEEAAMMALVAISRRHTAIYEGKMRDALPKIGATLDDATIPNIFPLLKVEPRAWTWLDDATRLRSTELCKNYKFGTANDEPILDALAIEPLKGHLIGRLKELEEGERLEVISKNPRIELVDEALTLLEESAHFRDAEPRARLALLGMGKLFSLDQVRRVLNAIPANYEIWNAAKMPGIVTSFFDSAIRHFEQAKGDWSTMQYELMKQHLWHHQPEKNYASLKAKLEAAGLGPFDWEKAKSEVKAELKAKWVAQDEDDE